MITYDHVNAKWTLGQQKTPRAPAPATKNLKVSRPPAHALTVAKSIRHQATWLKGLCRHGQCFERTMNSVMAERPPASWVTAGWVATLDANASAQRLWEKIRTWAMSLCWTTSTVHTLMISDDKCCKFTRIHCLYCTDVSLIWAPHTEQMSQSHLRTAPRNECIFRLLSLRLRRVSWCFMALRTETKFKISKEWHGMLHFNSFHVEPLPPCSLEFNWMQRS